MSRTMIAGLLIASVAGWAAADGPQAVTETSYVAPDGTRVLQHEVVVASSLDNVWRAFTFEEVPGRGTRIRAAGVGYGEGEAFGDIYEFFRAGNAWTLDQLRLRFENGPVNWRERLGEAPGAGSESAGGNVD